MATESAASLHRSRWVRILPAVVLIYVVAALDKSNISYAIAGGMSRSLALTTTFSGVVAGVFFIGYLFTQVPGAMVAERRSAKAYVGWSVFAFGAVSMLSALAATDWEMLLARFLLGVAEGGLFPAILIIITRWFPNEERGRANGFFLMNGAIAGVIGGPLASWLITMAGWRGLFVFEGAFSFVLLAIFLPLIKDRPEGSASPSAPAASSWRTTRDVLRHGNSWKLIVIYFCMSVGIYGFSLWLPTTIENLTHTGIGMAALLSAAPNVVSMIGCFALAAWSDRSGNRKLWTALGLLGFAVCLVVSNVLSGAAWLSFVFILGCGFFLHSPSGVFWTIPPLLSDPDRAAAERGVINALGNVGGFLGPFLVGWLTDLVNSTFGFYVVTVFTIVGMAVTFTLPSIGLSRPPSRAGDSATATTTGQ